MEVDPMLAASLVCKRAPGGGLGCGERKRLEPLDLVGDLAHDAARIGREQRATCSGAQLLERQASEDPRAAVVGDLSRSQDDRPAAATASISSLSSSGTVSSVNWTS